ncbi:APC family permease [Fundidesulfovibrio agrisoli]|uniref:APC family permease n=1 Tax=Fundidesulfovibrio agrisoli TaxID=2922717 RepID=UPI001FACF735|nr:APC family permease [Fundidesulfovibrio agrisoli]
MDQRASVGKRVKNALIGESLNLGDTSIFHHLSLMAFFAWVGLGADGLSSSCYGPEEAFLALGEHTFLAVFVALGTAVTILIISASYSQIIELFPSGGGGYLVASRLLSPRVGMVSGCALLIDYVLTITISIASGADAVFSSLPATFAPYKLETAVAGVLLLTLLNLRGVKESVTVLVPIFMTFVVTHVIALGYALGTHAAQGPELVAHIAQDASAAHTQLGYMGMFLLILRAYTMGAGTYTGIEAVSNGLPILREPKVRTGKRTMAYMAVSLAVTVTGLMLAYLLFDVRHQEGKTLNAVLFEALTVSWPAPLGTGFVWVTLASEALLLFVAAQAGFLDGPRVLANMSLDRWFPTRFSMLSDRLVSQNGILLMGGSALALMLISRGSVDFLIVLYSINVFITFVLSQMGMVRHWWQERHGGGRWFKGLMLNGLGLGLTAFILASVVVVKFFEGGWLTILITAALAALALKIKRHYDETWEQIRALDTLVESVGSPTPDPAAAPAEDTDAKTAVILVNGYNGLGLHTLTNVLRLHGEEFKNYVFLQVGVVDVQVMRDHAELDRLKQTIRSSMDKYIALTLSRGFHAEAHWAVGTDVVHEILELAPVIKERFPRCVFFGGQLVFEKETLLTRMLHNYVVFSLQRQIYKVGIPFMIMPIALREAIPAE